MVRIKLTAEDRQGQRMVVQPGEYSMAKNTLVFGILVNWYLLQVSELSFEITPENCTLNYKAKIEHLRLQKTELPWRMISLKYLQWHWSSHCIYLSL